MDKRPFLVSLLFILAATSLLDVANAELFYVGDSLGWLIPPGGAAAYATWVAFHTFFVGDILVFNFTTGQQDVAMVTQEAFLTCNSTNPISLKPAGPANFTLTTTGVYYFTSTLDKHCLLGQRLAINVSAPIPRTGPLNYTVGNSIGWLVPPGGELAYRTWAARKIFMVGDTLVFNFINGTQDVALVNKKEYTSCNTTSSINVWSISPANVLLNTTGEHFFTSTYLRHCETGQRLHINVTVANYSTPTTIAVPPASSSIEGPSAGGPMPVSSARPSAVVAQSFITLFFIVVMTLL